MSHPKLNLPQAPLRLRAHSDGTPREQVWDPLRRRWLLLTPEEWVRQHFVHYLVSDRGVEKHCIVQEHQLTVGEMSLRADIVVYRGAVPLLIVECKAPQVEITQQVFDQVAHYNMALGVRYLVVTNGMSHYCCEIEYESVTYKFIKNIPQL